MHYTDSWAIPQTRADVEAALDGGKLFLAMQGGRWWKARRNGATKLWKREPDRFVIPVKAGFKATGRVDQTWLGRGDLFRVEPTNASRFGE